MADHRTEIGGMWQKIGRLQFEFLLMRGLRPDHYLLDVGCGPLRGGVNFIQYLNHAHYFGIDKHLPFIRAAKEIELERYRIKHRRPQLHLTDDFDLSPFPKRVQFDFAVAFALFNHLDPRTIKHCLQKVMPRVSGKMYATFIEGKTISKDPRPHPKRPGEYVTVEYPFVFFEELSHALNISVGRVSDFEHPRGHDMMVFQRW